MSIEMMEAHRTYAELFFRWHPEYRPLKGNIEDSWNEEGVWWDDWAGSTHFLPWLQVCMDIAHLLPDGEE